jgi:three-Cys-motif partner protein
LVPHTAAKLGLLGAYLGPWFAILSLGGFRYVVYVDGFAGPGRYSGGEDGSPVVALKALAAHGRRLQSSFEFHFVERDGRTVDALTANINALRDRGLISPGTSVTIHARESFEDAYDQAIAPRLAQLAAAPAFVLEDTAFHAGHYKPLLREMEGTGRLTPVNPPPKRRKGTYGNPDLGLEFA